VPLATDTLVSPTTGVRTDTAGVQGERRSVACPRFDASSAIASGKPMRQVLTPLTCEPFIAAYLRQVRHLRPGGRSFALALETASGTFNADCDPDPKWSATASGLFKHRLLHVSLPFAHRLTDSATRAPLGRALGIESEEDLWWCIAVALYMHPEDVRLGDYYRRAFDPELQRDINAARRRILRTLRLLLSREADAQRLFQSRLAQAMGADRRGPVVAMSHCSREILMLVLVRLAGRGASWVSMETLDALMYGMLDGPSALAPGAGLVAGPVAATMADLKKLSAREGWLAGSDSHAKGDQSNQTSGGPQAGQPTSISDLSGPDVAEDEDEEEEEDESDPMQQAAEGGGGSPAGRPLLHQRNDLLEYEDILRRVLVASEASERRVTCADQSTSFANYSRFRSAAQLLSFATERPFRAAARGDLGVAVRGVFQPVCLQFPGVIAACGVYEACTTASRWGESHDNALDRVVWEVLETPAPPTRRQERDTLIGHVLEGAECLRQKYPDCGMTIELDVRALLVEAPSAAAVDLWLRATEQRLRTIPNRRRPGCAGALTELEALRGNLEPIMRLDRAKSLWALVTWLAGEVGCTGVKIPPKLILPTSSECRRLKRNLEGCFRTHFAKPDSTMPTLADIGMNRWLAGYDLLDRLMEGPSHANDGYTSAEDRVDKVKGFFTQLYAKGTESGLHTWSREEWEYLAYRVFTSLDPYRSIAQRVAEQNPGPLDPVLADLYRRLAAHGEVLLTLRTALDACCPSGGSSK